MKHRKAEQLQIRLTAEEKRTLRQAAARAGMDLSQWVLSRVLPDDQRRFHDLTQQAEAHGTRSYILAEINDFLMKLPRENFLRAVELKPPFGPDQNTRNYICAMVEISARRKNVPPPAWAGTIPSNPAPQFSSDLKNLRLHLLLHAPIALRRRNIFADSTVGDRV